MGNVAINFSLKVERLLITIAKIPRFFLPLFLEYNKRLSATAFFWCNGAGKTSSYYGKT